MEISVVLAFGALLAIAVLVSERAQRTVLSTAVLFLIGGFLLGAGGLRWMTIYEQDDVVGMLAELALFTILFVDGTRLPLAQIREAWRLPGRALLVGMPLTIAGPAVAAHLLVGVTWTEAFLVGAILSPW